MLKNAVALWLYLMGIVAVAGLIALTYNRGPMGWLNALQQWAFGRYFVLPSLIVVTGVITVAVVYLGPMCSRFFRRAQKPVTTLMPVPESNAWLLMALVFIIPTIWAVGYAAYAWTEYDLRQDLAADYPLVDLTATPAPARFESHLAIRGRYVFSASYTHQFKYSRPDYMLVPLVEPGWKKGQPVTFIAKITNEANFKHDRAGNSEPVLFATEGTMPMTTSMTLESMGVVMTSSTTVLRVVESQDGKPIAPQYGIERPDPFMVYWIVATVLTVLFTACSLGTYWSQNRYRRQRQQAARST